MIVTTTSLISGFDITEYIGVVFSQVVLGVNSFQEMGAGIRNVIGGRTSGYESEIKRAKEIALSDISRESSDKGANAIVGLTFDTEFIKMEKGGMILVSCSGTSCMIKKSIQL